jgi:hypothetical protein
VRERWRAGIWAGWSSRGETRRGARWSRGGGREIRRGDGVRVELYRRALLCRREGEGEQAQGRAQVNGRHRRALRVRVTVARHRRPTWQDEERPAEAARAVGEAARRHVGRKEGGAGLQQAREAAGGGGSRVRGRDRGDRGPEEEDEDRFAKS